MTSSRRDSDKGRDPHKNRMRVATTDDGRRSRSSFLTGNAAPAARLTGQNVRGTPQLKLEKVAQFMLRPSDGVHRVGMPGAGPRRVAQVRDHAPLRIGKPFVRLPRGNTRVTPEDRRRAVAQRERAAEDEKAENKGPVLGGFGVWPGLVGLNQGGNGPIRKEIGPKCRTNKENFGHFFF